MKTFLSEPQLANVEPLGAKRTQLTKRECCVILFLNLNGGPSYQLTERSSEPVTTRNGRSQRAAHVLMRFSWRSIVPTLVPVSHEKALAKLYRDAMVPS